jgi:hypothetical protein
MHLHARAPTAHSIYRKLHATAAESMSGQTRCARTVRSIHLAAARPAAAQTASAFRLAPVQQATRERINLTSLLKVDHQRTGAHPLLELLWIYLGVGILWSQQTPRTRALSGKLEWRTRTLVSATDRVAAERALVPANARRTIASRVFLSSAPSVCRQLVSASPRRFTASLPSPNRNQHTSLTTHCRYRCLTPARRRTPRRAPRRWILTF